MSNSKKKVRDTLIADCFGNAKGKKRCQILTEDVCLYGDCPFYKTKKQFNADRKKYGIVKN